MLLPYNIDLHNKSKCPFKFIQPKKGEQNILFKIKDSGSGINEDTCNIIKNILGIDTMNSSNFLGFGLLINKYIIQAMGGEIWFKTEIDIGTIFYANIMVNV